MIEGVLGPLFCLITPGGPLRLAQHAWLRMLSHAGNDMADALYALTLCSSLPFIIEMLALYEQDEILIAAQLLMFLPDSLVFASSLLRESLAMASIGCSKQHEQNLQHR